MKKTPGSLTVWLGLSSGLIGIKLALQCLPDLFRSPAQAAVFGWPLLPLWIGGGGLGAVLAERTGFPAPLDPRVPAARRWLWPALIGVGLGVLAILTDLATHWTRWAAAAVHEPTIHIAWPASLIIYPGGAVIVEVVYRLLTVPLLLLALGALPPLRRHGTTLFWGLAVLTALIEPLGDLSMASRSLAACALVFSQDLALNLAQAWTFRRAGFLAAILLRVWFYLVWHVAYGLTGA